jgi:hypothetical protein
MPVVINDFEVVAEPTPSESGADQAKDGTEKAGKPSLEEVFERFHERIERVRAH